MKCRNFLELAYETLKAVKAPLTAKQIWDKSQALGLEFESNGKTPWATISARIYVDMRDNPHSRFVSVSSYPALFAVCQRQQLSRIILYKRYPR